MSSLTSGPKIFSSNKKYNKYCLCRCIWKLDAGLLEPQLSFATRMPRDEQGALEVAVSWGRWIATTQPTRGRSEPTGFFSL